MAMVKSLSSIRKQNAFATGKSITVSRGMQKVVGDVGREDRASPGEVVLSFAIRCFEARVETRHGSTTQLKDCKSTLTFNNNLKGATNQPAVCVDDLLGASSSN